jgi:hypothetical protein
MHLVPYTTPLALLKRLSIFNITNLPLICYVMIQLVNHCLLTVTSAVSLLILKEISDAMLVGIYFIHIA